MRPVRSPVVIGLLALALLAGCSDPGEQLDRAPHHPSEDGAPVVDANEVRIPAAYEGALVIDPGWDGPVLEHDGTFLAASKTEHALRYTAIDSAGNVLWAAERPPECTGFTITETAQGRPLAVLTDTAGKAMTATAYELTTGEAVWGPVPTSGPHRGPGLVFGTHGEDAYPNLQRTTLDPTTGRQSPRSAALADGASIIGEHHGTQLLLDGPVFSAHAGTGTTLWSTDLSNAGWSPENEALIENIDSRSGLITLRLDDSTRALIDMHDGSIEATAVHGTATDLATETRLILQERTLEAFSVSGQRLWIQPAAPGTMITGAAGALVYLVSGKTIAVRNVLTGDLAQTYDPDGEGTIAVPTLVAETGAAILSAGERAMLATTEPAASGVHAG